jgi:GTP-binding protein
VPAGTVVHDVETGDLIADLAKLGDEVLVAHGGRGGWGNKRFATSTNQTPGFSQKGQQGEEADIRLELRLLADVGLIGLPNAGKSTFLSAVSNAKPKIANYPFTTLEPMLGVVNVAYDRFTLADLPGLVEGASEGYGLGFEFLKHIRRCRVLLHLIDSSSPDPVTDYELIEGELRAYDPKLEQVARVVAVSKADLDETQARLAADTLEAHIGRPVRVISAELETGVEALLAELMALVRSEKEKPVEESPDEIPVLRPASEERFSVHRDEQGRYVVEGYRAVSFVNMMDTEMPGAYDEILRRLERWGIAKVLRREGIQPGDTMLFGETEVEWDA